MIKNNYQFFILGILTFIILFITLNNSTNKINIDYERIKNDFQSNINLLNSKIDSISRQNSILVIKLDSLKRTIPNHKAALEQINNQINTLNESYKDIDYYSSSDSALIQRLSR